MDTPHKFYEVKEIEDILKVKNIFSTTTDFSNVRERKDIKALGIPVYRSDCGGGVLFDLYIDPHISTNTIDFRCMCEDYENQVSIVQYWGAFHGHLREEQEKKFYLEEIIDKPTNPGFILVADNTQVYTISKENYEILHSIIKGKDRTITSRWF